METVQQNGRLTLFLVNSPLIYILFSMFKIYTGRDRGVRRKYPGGLTDTDQEGLIAPPLFTPHNILLITLYIAQCIMSYYVSKLKITNIINKENICF